MTFIKEAGKKLADVIPGLNAITFDPSLGTIFVTSGTGLIGYRVALSLLEAGHKSVRVGVWYGDRQIGDDETLAEKVTKKLQEKGAEVVAFDWSDDKSHAAALAGVKTVFATIPHMNGWSDVFPSFLRTCKNQKVEHFVKVSFFKAGDITNPYRKNVPFVKFHGTCDDVLEQVVFDSRMSFTILCASHLMATPLLHQGSLLRDEHKFVTASYGMGVNYISPNDVASAAMVVLLNRKEHKNKIYNLSGPYPITDRAVCKLLSEFYDTPIEHIPLGYHDYEKDVKKRGLPDWLVKDSAALEKMKASGIDELPSSFTKDLEKLIGRKPETFREYITNKSAMRPGLSFP
jgi:nucleoside-diphosphate-sugar epimerase